MTFKELYDKYINYKKIKLKAQSIRSIESRFNLHILPFFYNYNVNEITNDIYIKWQREIEQKCYKHKYNSALHIAMVNIFNYGIKFYNIKQNIPSLTGNFINKTEIYKKPTYWDFDEFKKFINVIEDKLYKTLFETEAEAETITETANKVVKAWFVNTYVPEVVHIPNRFTR